MPMFFRKKQSLIGLDIGSHTVKVVELEALPKGGHRLVNYGISEPLHEAIVDGEIMDRQLVTDAIANLLESRGIRTKHVVAAVSGEHVIHIPRRRSSHEPSTYLDARVAERAVHAGHGVGEAERVLLGEIKLHMLHAELGR